MNDRFNRNLDLIMNDYMLHGFDKFMIFWNYDRFYFLWYFLCDNLVWEFNLAGWSGLMSAHVILGFEIDCLGCSLWWRITKICHVGSDFRYEWFGFSFVPLYIGLLWSSILRISLCAIRFGWILFVLVTQVTHLLVKEA